MNGFGNFKKNNVSFSRPITSESDILDEEVVGEECDIDDEIEYKILVGQKKRLLIFLVNNRSKSDASLSGPIMYNDISRSLRVSKESVPVLLSRLVKTGLVSRHRTKLGRTGYVIFKYSPFIRRKFENLQ